jgi:hypothetical protein
MHLWNINSLAEELRHDTLTEADVFKYFFVLVIISSVSWGLQWLFGMGTPLVGVPYGFVFPLLSVGIIILGVTLCFRAFQRQQGRQFIQKFICLLLPANIRAFVFCLPLYIVAVVITLLFPTEQHHQVLVLSNAFIIAVMLSVQFTSIYRNLGSVSDA